MTMLKFLTKICTGPRHHARTSVTNPAYNQLVTGYSRSMHFLRRVKITAFSYTPGAHLQFHCARGFVRPGDLRVCKTPWSVFQDGSDGGRLACRHALGPATRPGEAATKPGEGKSVRAAPRIPDRGLTVGHHIQINTDENEEDFQLNINKLETDDNNRLYQELFFTLISIYWVD